MSGYDEHRSSYPMGNIHHGTPERPDWGPFCVECKESWPCEASELIAERDALAEKVRRIEELADAWGARWDEGQRQAELTGEPVQRFVRCNVAAETIRTALADGDQP